MKKYFLIIQPNNFNNPLWVDRIVLFNEEKNLILDGLFSPSSYMEIKKLMCEEAIFITYNGELLYNMLWQFWGFNEYKKIIDLMEQFAVVYGKYKDWDTEDGSLYIWQKLETALKYYNLRGYKIKDCKIDIYDPRDVLEKTIILYECMQDWEEKQLLRDLERGVI